MSQKNPAKGPSIKTSVIRITCYLDPVAEASATVFDAIPQALQNVSYSVAYHLLADENNPASVERVQAMAAQCTAVGWNRYWVKKALHTDAAEQSDAGTAADGAAGEQAQQRMDASMEAAQEAGVSELPCITWQGRCFVGADAVEQLVDALIHGARG